MGPGPVLFWCFSAFCFAFSAGETQVWLGDLRVVALVWLLVFCFATIDLLISRTVRPCTDGFAAYSHVRTEPLARHRPNSRKKNKNKIFEGSLSFILKPIAFMASARLLHTFNRGKQVNCSLHKEQPFRHDIHSDTSKQTPTTPGRNESGEKRENGETGG